MSMLPMAVLPSLAHPLLFAAELVDDGWTRLCFLASRSKRDATTLRVTQEAALRLEGKLAQERLEVKRLNAVIEEYQRALVALLQERSDDLAWMGSALGDGEQQHSDILRQIELKINSPENLLRLRVPPQTSESDQACTRIMSKTGEIEVAADVEDSEWWQWVTDLDMKGGVSREECEGLDGEPAYEMVDVDEVVEGIALILARYIALHPEYQSMTPQQLEHALASGFNSARRTGLFHRLRTWSAMAYNTSRATSCLLSIYKERMLVRAIVGAIFVSCRIMFRV